MKILYIGHRLWGCLALNALMESGQEIVGVVAEPEKVYVREPQSRYNQGLKKHNLYGSVKDFAGSKGLPVFQPDDINEESFVNKIEQMNPDLTVIVNYHHIIKEPLISKCVFINAHGGILPDYRGTSCVNWAMINGEKETGVTVHYIERKIDSGDIIVQERIPIGIEDYVLDVLKKILPVYPRVVLEAVNQIEAGTVKRIKQDFSKGAYYKERRPEDGLMRWNEMTTIQAYNWIRALSDPYPGAFSYYKSQKLIVWRSSLPAKPKKTRYAPGYIIGKDGSRVEVTTGDSTIFLEKVQIEGDEEKDASECLELRLSLG